MLRRLIGGLAGVVSILAIWPGQAQARHLFDERSGFAKARGAGESIRVCAPPGIDGPSMTAPWNELAGWRLFALSCEDPDVTFVPDQVTWAQAPYRQSFTHCIIHYSSSSTKVHQHEIGHCLGFADHVAPGDAENPRWVNPGECPGYRGVMSYCDWDGRRWFGDDDRAMLTRAGYAAPVSKGTDGSAGNRSAAKGGASPMVQGSVRMGTRAPANTGARVPAHPAHPGSRTPRFPWLRWLIEFLSRSW